MRRTVLSVEGRQDIIKVTDAIVLGRELICASPLTIYNELEQLLHKKKERERLLSVGCLCWINWVIADGKGRIHLQSFVYDRGRQRPRTGPGCPGPSSRRSIL